MAKGKFTYVGSHGRLVVSGYFNIYQARNGRICIVMGSSFTALTKQQVDELKIDVYTLADFDYDAYLQAYMEEAAC